MLYELTKVLPHVYRLHFEDPYQLAMHFLRAQEYYESPKFADKLFTLVEFMEWYSEAHGQGAFTYPRDWSGFNVPSWVLEKVCREPSKIPDPNKYDRTMILLFWRIFHQENAGYAWDLPPKPFYLIGTSAVGHKGDGDIEAVLDHELAHAMYYTDEKYKADTEQLLYNLEGYKPKRANSFYSRLSKVLAKAGYHQRTIRDEIQAYASTGANVWGMEQLLTPAVCRSFEENFQEHKKRLQKTMK